MAKGKPTQAPARRRKPIKETPAYKKLEKQLQSAKNTKKKAMEKIEKAQPMNVGMQLGGSALNGVVNGYLPPQFKTIGDTPIRTTAVISTLGILGSFWIPNDMASNAVRQVSSGMLCVDVGTSVEQWIINRRSAA